MRILLLALLCALVAACSPVDEGGGGDLPPEDAGGDAGVDAGEVDAGELRCPTDFACEVGARCRADGTCEVCAAPTAADGAAACAAAGADCGRIGVPWCGVTYETSCGVCGGVCGQERLNVCWCEPRSLAQRCQHDGAPSSRLCGPNVRNFDGCMRPVFDDCGPCLDGWTCGGGFCEG